MKFSNAPGFDLKTKFYLKSVVTPSFENTHMCEILCEISYKISPRVLSNAFQIKINILAKNKTEKTLAKQVLICHLAIFRFDVEVN